MKLEGIHHVTAITGDAPGNMDFYTGMLGLRLVIAREMLKEQRAPLREGIA